jgi:hypothetical protein
VAYPPEGANDIKFTTETLTCPSGKRVTEAGVRNLRAADGTPTEVKGDPVFGAGWTSMADPVSSGNQLGPYGPTDAGAWRLVGTLSLPGWGDPASPERPAGFGWFGAVVTYYVVCIGS